MRRDKARAIQLRRSGKSYNEIKEILGAPKSTLSGWLNGVAMSPAAKERLWDSSRIKWARNFAAFNERRSKESLENARLNQIKAARDVGYLSRRELMLVGSALYWAEGNKKNRWTVRFTNSDPALIALIMKFFRKVCGAKEDKFIAAMQIYPNISEHQAMAFWSGVTGIPKRQFRKTLTSVSKSSKFIRPANSLPYGTLQINISDVKLVNRIKGWMLGLSRA
ncbi:MAG: hypothetical protein Q8N85_06440 [Candidatus Omnitrophota bacterium]|nr:hypothetical protein [Candidatus Omnitrophota bacterium]